MAYFRLETINVNGRDLHGITTAGSDSLAIHVHGTWGNFYGNPFINATADLYNRLGYAFLSANFPGHDETAVSENFDDFTPALDAWVDTMDTNASIILQGHSLGALKILRYMRDTRARTVDRIQAIVLLAPFDVVAFYSGGKLETLPEKRAATLRAISEQGEAALVPASVFDTWQLSARTFLQLTESGGVADQFPSRVGLAKVGHGIRCPILVAIGSEDFAAYPDATSVIEMLQGGNSVVATLIDGAPHNMAGRVPELCSAIERRLGEWTRVTTP
jgi:pimeloyl-ACP methyl ester carboxylesterase